MKQVQKNVEDSVVVHQQDQIDVYPNNSGGITIRSVSYPDGEAIIAFLPQYAEAIIAAIRGCVNRLEECDGALQED